METGVNAHVGSQAVDRAAALLTLVVEAGRPRSFTSLVDELGLARSTTSRLLQALERNRLVRRDRSGGYRAGPLFDAYATHHDSARDLGELAQPHLEALGRKTGETINLAVPNGDGLLQVSQVDSRHMLGATSWLGVDVPTHCAAVGKVFYAYGALPVPAGRLTRRTRSTVTSQAVLARQLDEVRRCGWAVAWEELEVGLIAVAAPVRDAQARVVAGISVSGPVTRMTRSKVNEIGDLLVAKTGELSRQLGHHPDKEVIA